MTNTTSLVRDLGIPVRAAVPTGPFPGRNGAGAPCLYVVFGQESGHGLFLLQIDPRTGACRRADAPAGFSGGRSSYWSERWQRVFLASSFNEHKTREGGHLLAFDPAAGRIDDLGPVCPGKVVFPCGIAEAADGTVWIGCYAHAGKDGACWLTRYDPATGAFRQYGRMDETDLYAYPACGDDGTVAVLVKMSRPHVVLVDPDAGTHRTVGPTADVDAQQGFVYLYKGADGLLYLNTHAGGFVLRGGDATPVEALPPARPAPTLPDGSTFRWLDGRGQFRYLHKTIEVTAPTGEARMLTLDYEAAGCGLYLVRPGPDGKLYGSSILPLHFFSHDPATGDTIDYGSCSTASGEVYSMDSLDGKLYICVYTHAILNVYDPAKPYTFGQLEHMPADLAPLPRQQDRERWLGWSTALGHPDYSNPCILGRMDSVAYRPRDMIAGPAGKVWVASMPDYGMWGGTLSWYDPATDTFGGAHRDVVPDCSLIALTYVPEIDRLLVGSCIYGGSGTTPRVDRAALARWDPAGDAPDGLFDLGLRIIGVMDLEYAGHGLAYAIIHVAPEDVLHAELVLFDPRTGRIVAQTDLSAAAGWPLEVAFQRDDVYLYGATRAAIYRVKLGTVDVEVLWHDDADGPTVGGALIDGDYYFGSGDRLRAIRVSLGAK